MAVQIQPVSKMVLFSSVLAPNTTNTFGTSNALNTELRFSSISLKNILGDLYDKYDSFNISLTSVTVAQSAATYGVGNNTLIQLYMSGPAFKQSNTYSNITRTSQTSAFMGHFQLPVWVANSSSVLTFNNSFCNTFDKFGDFVDITLTLRSPTGALQVPTNAYPLMVYNFTIVGVDGAKPAVYVHKADEMVTMSSRMDGHNGPNGPMAMMSPPSNAQRSYDPSKFYLTR
jgi:hypothetical protein